MLKTNKVNFFIILFFSLIYNTIYKSRAKLFEVRLERLGGLGRLGGKFIKVYEGL